MNEPIIGYNAFLVDRDTWARAGAPLGKSTLLNTKGNKCCLGFAALAVGFETRHISGIGMPCLLDFRRVSADQRNSPLGKMLADGEVCSSLSWVNDNAMKLDSHKETLIIERAATVGVHVTFINGGKPPHGKLRTATRALTSTSILQWVLTTVPMTSIERMPFGAVFGFMRARANDEET